VQKFLGKGAYGSVYLVERMSDHLPYAVKETDVSKMGAVERQDAANEIRLLASVRHPNIIRCALLEKMEGLSYLLLARERECATSRSSAALVAGVARLP
jgi:serine/threonine protein kinase